MHRREGKRKVEKKRPWKLVKVRAEVQDWRSPTLGLSPHLLSPPMTTMAMRLTGEVFPTEVKFWSQLKKEASVIYSIANCKVFNYKVFSIVLFSNIKSVIMVGHYILWGWFSYFHLLFFKNGKCTDFSTSNLTSRLIFRFGLLCLVIPFLRWSPSTILGHTPDVV